VSKIRENIPEITPQELQEALTSLPTQGKPEHLHLFDVR